jgi:hypothetical protein
MSEVQNLSGRQISIMRRKALGNGGKGSYNPATMGNVEATPLVERKGSTNTSNATTTSKRAGKKVAIKQDAIIQGGRAQSIAFRKASNSGKSAQKSFQNSGSVSVATKIASPDVSSREIAKQVRMERCTRGKCATKGSANGAGSSSKIRKSKPVSSDDSSSTLGGQNISGTRVGKTSSITGSEKGFCKTVSGSEYLGAEEFTNCSDTPKASPKKVITTTTNKGMSVSGTDVGQSETLTGNKSGQCASITGSEYLPAESQNDFCGGTSPSNKSTGFSVMSPTSNTNSRSGITDSSQNRATQSTTIKSNPAPQKVVNSQTLKGNSTTGTQVGRVVSDITGSESGACKNVTGIAYVGIEEVADCDTSITDGATKVVVSGTGNGQVITGDRSGGNDGVTGNSGGNCQAVTGTPYVGAENAQACDTNAVNEIEVRKKQEGNADLSGAQIAPIGLTGAQKGACSLITGEQVYSANTASVACVSSNAAVVGDSDYPVSANSANSPVVAPEAVANASAGNITGDGWDRGDKVTGVDGEWSAGRNSSIKGADKTMPIGANFRPTDNEVPMSPITGSSGNTDTGAKVTLSGGARA